MRKRLVTSDSPSYNTEPLFVYFLVSLVESVFMALSAAQKAQVVEKYKRSEKDTGSSEVQIALLSTRINELTEHLKKHKHDFHTRYGLTNLVSQRRRLMRYLKNSDNARYLTIIKALDIRGLA